MFDSAATAALEKLRLRSSREEKRERNKRANDGYQVRSWFHDLTEKASSRCYVILTRRQPGVSRRHLERNWLKQFKAVYLELAISKLTSQPNIFRTDPIITLNFPAR